MAGTIELDGGTDFSLKNARFLIRLCQAAYDFDDSRIRELFAPERPVVRHFEGTLDSHGFVVRAGPLVVVVFRGTYPLSIVNWWTDEAVLPVAGRHGIPERIHQGFADAFDGLQDGFEGGLRDLADEQLLWVTGHSLGGALATLASVVVADRPSFQGVYTFGSPRVGDPEFASQYRPTQYRVVNKNDIVPQVPPRGASYQHVGTRVHLIRPGQLVVSDPGEDPDGSLLPEQLDGPINTILQALPRNLATLDPLQLLTRFGPGLATPLDSIAKVLQLPFDFLEDRVVDICEGLSSDFCDHFPASYIRSLDEIVEG